MQAKLDKLKKYLDRLSDDTGWYIIIADYYGVLRDHEGMCTYLSQRRWHINPYCMKIKENKALWQTCIEQQTERKMCAQERGRGGWHVCHCGVAEYTLPVFIGNIHAFSVGVAGFFAPLSEDVIAGIAEKTQTLSADIKKMRDSHLEAITDKLESGLECYVGVIGDMLSHIFCNDPLLKEQNNATTLQQKYVLSALDYVDDHYFENISPKNVAQHCNVSLSYLQHLFLIFTGEGIATAIRRKRMEYACELLSNTDKSVRSIALICGFYDTDYFSVVFKRTYGITPLKFRKHGFDTKKL